jgi:hypothetical protein
LSGFHFHETRKGSLANTGKARRSHVEWIPVSTRDPRSYSKSHRPGAGSSTGLPPPPDTHPAPAPAAKRRTETARGGAERNPGSRHPMTSRPNGANGDHTHPVPCTLSGHGGLCVVWSPGFHPGLSPVTPSGHEHSSGIWVQATGNSPGHGP